MLLMTCDLTLRAPYQADSYMKSSTRDLGKSLMSASSLVVQLNPLGDFQLSSGFAPRPGTSTILS